MIISYADALQRINDEPTVSQAEAVHLEDCLGRVLAESLTAGIPSPPFTNSAMDGFAFVHREAEPAKPLRVADTVLAKPGLPPKDHRPGECVRIMTGAPVPPWADTVIPVEKTSPDGQSLVHFHDLPPAGANIRCAGEDISPGEVVLETGTALSPEGLMIAASFGYATLQVLKKPTVGIFTTGDELQMPGSELAPGTIFNSSHFFLGSACRGIGLTPALSRHIRDDAGTAADAIGGFVHEEGSDTKIIVSTGAVSAGDRDFIPSLAQKMGFNEVFHGVAVRPGKPVFLAKRANCYWLGLAGNAISTNVGFHFFLRPLLHAIAGIRLPTSAVLTLAENVTKPYNLRCFFRSRTGGERVHVFSGQGSSHLRASADCNCYVELPEGTSQILAGTPVKVTFI